jgi:RNA polymerase sigma-70 factor (ECF subfamily)
MLQAKQRSLKFYCLYLYMLFKKRTNISDKELIEGCLKGKEKYYKMLYDNHYGKMFNVCLRYARDREEAQDILQEGYIRVFKNLHQYDFKGSFEGWIKRVIVTTAINYYRKNNLRSITDYVDSDNLLTMENNNVVIDENNSMNQLEAKDLLSIIQQLPPVYKMVFNLNAIEGYSHKEISNMMGITESTSRSNLSKARAKLQEMVTPLIQNKTLSHAG